MRKLMLIFASVILSGFLYAVPLIPLQVQPSLVTLNLFVQEERWVTLDAHLALDGGATIPVTGVSVLIATPNFLDNDALRASSLHGISVSYNMSSGELLLFSDAVKSTFDYQGVLRTVQFKVYPQMYPQREIVVRVNRTSFYFDGNGHYYEVIDTGGVLYWEDARTLAENRTFFGQRGYLMTLTDSSEQAYIQEQLDSNVWLGASDAAVEGTWRWVTGPESGQLLSYTNWHNNEPNNAGNEDYGHFLTSGKWNDFRNVRNDVPRYAVEYGGYVTERDLILEQSFFIRIREPNVLNMGLPF